MRGQLLRVAGAALLSSACIAEEAFEPAPAAADSYGHALRGGEPAPAESQVVAVVNIAGGQCTGSPITPDLVLTARHCVGATNESTNRVDCDETRFVDPDSAGAMFVLTTPTVTEDPADYHRVRTVRVLPDGDASLCGRDIALLELSEPLDVRPLIPRVDVPARAGDAYAAYGYGDDEAEQGSGVRRQLLDRQVLCAGKECADEGVRDTEFLGSDGVCGGDSGGPALDPERRIAGVVSRGFAGCTGPIYGDVAAFADFLKSEALAAAARGGYEAPAWALGHSTERRFNHPIGASCRDDSQCESGLCGEDGRCTRECSAAGPCPSGHSCSAETSVCQADVSTSDGEPPPASSCRFARAPGHSTWGAWLLALLLLVRARGGSARARWVRMRRGFDERR